MTNKFTIGSQWITKGGWRAVVVDVDGETLKVCHKADYVVHHYDNGEVMYKSDDYNLDTPYNDLNNVNVEDVRK